MKSDLPLKENTSKNRIAVLSSEGEITTGKGSNDIIGSDKFVEELKKLRNDKKVKAIVLRINSPGGSSLASDIMWNEVELTKKVKPVIASFSDYAASGGYYMGMGAHAIVAQPTTITGSIGIFMMLFNAHDFMKNKLGITTDNVSTNANSDFPSVTRQLSPFENNVLQTSVNQGYEMFTGKAAQGRNMDINKLKAIASGRVWTGLQAKQNGLIDELGGLDMAIKLAAKKAKLSEGDYSIKYATQKKSMLEELFEMDAKDTETKLFAKQLGFLAPYFKKMQTFVKMDGMQTRMEYDVELK